MDEAAAGMDLNRLIDRLVNNAWPAPETIPLGGWLLRSSGGLTRRANSVYTSADYPDVDWLVEAERFYRSRGLPVRFQVSAGSPPGLGEQLSALGYVRDGESFIFTAGAGQTAQLASSSQVAPVTFVSDAVLTESWLEDFLRIEGRSTAGVAGYRAIMSDITRPAVFVSAMSGDQVLGVGTGVYEQGWAGLMNIATAPEARRRGIASGIVGEIARWAIGRGAAHLYLQVMQQNAPAISLYRNLGFAPLSTYYYATEPRE